MVIQMAQRGQLATKIDENKLIELLERAGESEEKQRTKVTVRVVDTSTMTREQSLMTCDTTVGEAANVLQRRRRR
jgi:hypothetical protein